MRGQEITTEQISRQQKVLEAKAAFGRRSQEGTMQKYHLADTYEPAEQETVRHPFRLLRIMTAWMLLLVLLVAFYNGFSYRGFDRQYVQKVLNDESTWNALEEKVQAVYQNITEKK